MSSLFVCVVFYLYCVLFPIPPLCCLPLSSLSSCMDKLLHSLEKSNAGISVCNLHLGGAAHADDVRTISTSIKGAIDQSNIIISQFSRETCLTLNSSKTKIVRFFSCQPSNPATIDIQNPSSNSETSQMPRLSVDQHSALYCCYRR